MMQRQLEHREVEFERKRLPVTLVLDDVTDGKNVGSVFRLADAMGVNKILLCGKTAIPPHKHIRKTARSTEKFVEHAYYESCVDLIKKLQTEGKTVCALEITDGSRELNTCDFTHYPELVVVAGAEETGIRPEVLSLLDLAIHIPMLGMNSSMNVAMATAIALQEITRQWQKK